MKVVTCTNNTSLLEVWHLQSWHGDFEMEHFSQLLAEPDAKRVEWMKIRGAF